MTSGGYNLVIAIAICLPGVELVHFCTNEKSRDVWRKLGIPRSIGEVIFWSKIVPLFYEVQKIVGCEYAFLFCCRLV